MAKLCHFFDIWQWYNKRSHTSSLGLPIRQVEMVRNFPLTLYFNILQLSELETISTLGFFHGSLGFCLYICFSTGINWDDRSPARRGRDLGPAGRDATRIG